jgi:hypothetical protein
MLTIFTVPKPFRGHIGIIQRNAVRSWLLLRPACEIILLGNDCGTKEVAEEFGIQNIPDIARNEYGTPLVSSAFQLAENAARHTLLCYINADIILFDDFMEAVKSVARRKRRFLMVGQRWDLEVTDPLDFSEGWQLELREKILNSADMHPPTGIDYFVFPRGAIRKIPPFALGRTVWDNWLLYRARSRGVPLIDATQAVMAVHQNHDYSHLRNGVDEAWTGVEAQRNLSLAGGYEHVYTLQDATLLLTGDGLVPAHPLHPQRGRLSTLTEGLQAKSRRILSMLSRVFRAIWGLRHRLSRRS